MNSARVALFSTCTLFLAFLTVPAKSSYMYYPYHYPQRPYGFPNRLLRYGYMAWGTNMLNCDQNFLARLYKRQERIMDYPNCAYGYRGLYNNVPFYHPIEH